MTWNHLATYCSGVSEDGTRCEAFCIVLGPSVETCPVCGRYTTKSFCQSEYKPRHPELGGWLSRFDALDREEPMTSKPNGKPRPHDTVNKG